MAGLSFISMYVGPGACRSVWYVSNDMYMPVVHINVCRSLSSNLHIMYVGPLVRINVSRPVGPVVQINVCRACRVYPCPQSLSSILVLDPYSQSLSLSSILIVNPYPQSSIIILNPYPYPPSLSLSSILILDKYSPSLSLSSILILNPYPRSLSAENESVAPVRFQMQHCTAEELSFFFQV